MAQSPIFLAFEPWLKHLYYWPLSHGSNIHIIGLWAMAQTNQLLDFEPWLKLINYWTLSHGSNSSIIGLWAMALTHQLLDFEPWLNPPRNRTLSHGSEKFPSNPHFLGVRAMAQTHIWHADFNLAFRGNKIIDIHCFIVYTLYYLNQTLEKFQLSLILSQ